jgi:hypothetical protein
MAKPFKDWINVPDGSSYELSLTTVQGAGTGSADIVDDQGTQTTWNDAKIHPGPASLPLKSPRFYNVILTVALTKKGTNELKVEAKVVKPDGSAYGTNYVDTVKGKNGSIGVILFTMETA